MNLRTLGGILAVALSVTGCATAVDGAGVVGNEPGASGASTVTVASPGIVRGASNGRFGGPTNLVPNGSFEQPRPFPWQAFMGAKLAFTTSAHRFGKLALLVQPEGKSPTAVGAAIVGLVGQPTRGSRYSFSAWVKASPPGSLAEVELSVIKAHQKTWTQVAAEGRRVTGSWQHLSVRGTVRIRNAVYLRATISLNDIARGSRLAIDGVRAKTLSPGLTSPVG